MHAQPAYHPTGSVLWPPGQPSENSANTWLGRSSVGASGDEERRNRVRLHCTPISLPTQPTQAKDFDVQGSGNDSRVIVVMSFALHLGMAGHTQRERRKAAQINVG